MDNLGSVVLSVMLSTAALTDSSVTMGGQVSVCLLFMLNRFSELTCSCIFCSSVVEMVSLW